MPKKLKYTIALLCLSIGYFSVTKAQNQQLVWADEFNGSSLDKSIWSFELGQFNDCVHYSTDRPANTKLVDGKLQLIALKESYMGYNYTASVIKTKHTVHWRYGRIEARIKLPSSNGFVPAFWLLPEDERFGWWPASGEIDIMEHPTNEVNKIYGTVHTSAYNSFTGSGPRGGTVVIPDAESAFHLYAVEWTPEKIDFFVDEQKYFTFQNNHSGFQTWPFDQPFYIILNMAVGGGWVGDPTSSTIFPAVMEVDYVRVYQIMDDFSIHGPDFVNPIEKNLTFSAPTIAGAQYEWSVPNTARITSGEKSSRISVDWGVFTGTVEVLMTLDAETQLTKYPVHMSTNLLKNGDIEKGTTYWNTTIAYPVAAADFALSTSDAHTGERSIMVDVKSPGANAWDVQLSQTNLALKTGQRYNVSFFAKSETSSAITAAIINAANYSLYASETFQLANTWTPCTFNFVAPATAIGSFNIDLGGHTGRYHFDDFQVNWPAVETTNQVLNADFSDGDSDWIFNSFSTAVAQGSVKDGEYAVDITNGGVNAWDVHIGQTGFHIEKDKEYTVSFDAYASAPRNIFPLVGKNSEPWTVYSGDETVSLSTHRKTYTIAFTMTEPTDSQARLGFDIGASSEDVFLDNVFLSQGNWPAGVSGDKPSSPLSFQLYPNWPNPFNPVTTIEFELPIKSFVSLKIYDINGKLIKTLLEKNMDAGVHLSQWNGSGNASGVYVCILSANGHRQVHKMTLVK